MYKEVLRTEHHTHGAREAYNDHTDLHPFVRHRVVNDVYVLVVEVRHGLAHGVGSAGDGLDGVHLSPQRARREGHWAHAGPHVHQRHVLVRQQAPVAQSARATCHHGTVLGANSKYWMTTAFLYLLP